MTYARARLWLGISGVGTVVLLATLLLTTRWHESILANSETWSDGDLWAMIAFVGAFVLVMLPFDLLGGFVLPNRYGRQQASFADFFGRWLITVALQSTLFVITGISILTVGRLWGLPGVLALIGFVSLTYVTLQGRLVCLTTNGALANGSQKIRPLLKQLRQWRIKPQSMIVVDHTDPGFTGGVVGLHRREQIIIPLSWFEKLSPKQLAVAVARRIAAVDSQSRSIGLLLALLWVWFGFWFSTYLPGAGFTSAAELVTTCCGFTLWTFFGLLTLPTVSRHASYSIDYQILKKRQAFRHGISAELLNETLAALDRLQDDEPERSSLVESIFHPVPSVANRRKLTSSTRAGTWHAARMVLFLSWSCMGLLLRRSPLQCWSARTLGHVADRLNFVSTAIMKVYYSDTFELPLPTGHHFPINKYRSTFASGCIKVSSADSSNSACLRRQLIGNW